MNISRVGAGEAFCLCGNFIGQVDGGLFYFHHPIRLSIPANSVDPSITAVMSYVNGVTLSDLGMCVL